MNLRNETIKGNPRSEEKDWNDGADDMATKAADAIAVPRNIAALALRKIQVSRVLHRLMVNVLYVRGLGEEHQQELNNLLAQQRD